MCYVDDVVIGGLGLAKGTFEDPKFIKIVGNFEACNLLCYSGSEACKASIAHLLVYPDIVLHAINTYNMKLLSYTTQKSPGITIYYFILLILLVGTFHQAHGKRLLKLHSPQLFQ